MQTSATNKRIRELLKGLREKSIIPNPHFQRRLVWSNAHKIAFLETVLQGLPFPEIFMAAGSVDPDSGEGNELIVDGQQRITTLNQYFIASPDLKIPNGRIPAYKNLSDDEKRKFLEYQIVVRDLGQLTEDQTRDMFQRINSTRYALNAMEVNNSRFDGALKRFAEDISNEAFFQENAVFTALDGRRMNDIRFTLTLIISMLSGYFNRDDEHELYLEQYNDDFPEVLQIERRFRATAKFLDSCKFPAKSRIWQKADLLTVLVETDRALHLDSLHVTPTKVGRELTTFFNEVDEVTRSANHSEDAGEYYRRVRSGVNDRISRISRGGLISERLKSAAGTGPA